MENHPTTGASASMVFPLLRVPLGNGKAGQFTSTFNVLGQDHQITVDFFAWTPHTLTFMGLTLFCLNPAAPTSACMLPDVSALGSFDLNSNGAGTVTLVSPSKVSINGKLVQSRTVSITTLKLTFVPEPGTLLLLGAAGLGLLSIRRPSYGYGRRRRGAR